MRTQGYPKNPEWNPRILLNNRELTKLRNLWPVRQSNIVMSYAIKENKSQESFSIFFSFFLSFFLFLRTCNWKYGTDLGVGNKKQKWALKIWNSWLSVISSILPFLNKATGKLPFSFNTIRSYFFKNNLTNRALIRTNLKKKALSGDAWGLFLERETCWIVV